MSDYSYLLKIKPLEPYFFGDENTIRFDNSNRYYVCSMNVPSATTIMGMLRHTILEQTAFYKPSGKYDDSVLPNISERIGSHSFSPNNEDTSYGIIKGVSPVVLTDSLGNIYIKCPLNQNPKAGQTVFAPMQPAKTRRTSFGEIALPKFDAKSYDTVKPYEKFLNTTDGTLKSEYEIFMQYEKITIKKVESKEAFVKKCFKQLNGDFSFAVIVTLSEQIEFNGVVCHMGRERSSFALSASECRPSYIGERISGEYLGMFGGFSYVLGDLILAYDDCNNKAEVIPQYGAYAVVNMKNLRSLTTNIVNTSISLDKVLYNTVTAGSVFCDTKDRPQTIKTKGTDKFGTNVIISIGDKNMNAKLYKITCLTNMHVGNGDVNFNIIDKEVEKDPVTGCPTINASGVKGALKQHFEENKCDENTIQSIFGKGNEQNDTGLNTGKVKIFPAHMLARPMRTSEGDVPYQLVTTKALLDQLKSLTDAIFGNVGIDIAPQAGDACTVEGVSIESKTHEILGDIYYIMNFDDFKDVPLPVLARNCINGVRNLWYEEVVPHETVMYFIASSSDNEAFTAFGDMIATNPIVQFGGNASIGYGVCKVEEVLSRE